MGNISRRDFIRGTMKGAVSAAALGMIGAPGLAMAEGSAAAALFNPGTYTSVQTGSFATIEVSCVFSETALTDVSYQVLSTSKSDYFPLPANQMEQYCQRIVENGKAQGVDGMTGATICSNMIRDGVNACTAQALGLPAAAGAAAASQLNPQDENFDSFSGDLSAVFSPIRLGSMELPNRIAKSAGSAVWADANKDRIPTGTELYGTMAENGVSLNIFAGSVFGNKFIAPGEINKEGPDDEATVTAALESMKPLMDRIHAAGGKVGYQLHYGGNAPVVPDEKINDVTIEDLDDFIEKVGISAQRGKRAGFDCIEIKGASADGLNGFLSRRVNRREDEYGAQNTENRTRFFRRCIEKIKEVNGADFPVGVLINAVEENDVALGDNSLFTTIDESKAIAKALVEAGADWIQLRVGTNGQEMNIWAPDVQHFIPGADGITGYGTMFDYRSHYDGMMDGSHSGFASFLPMVKAIKEAVNVPVGCAANMDLRLGPDYLNEAIKRGDLDLIFMNRPLNCDPELVKKMQEGRREDVRPCMKCMHCHDNIATGRKYPSSCRMNAASFIALTKDLPEGATPLPAAVKKNVLVIGGGPAGAEAARVAAERGHAVTLCEATDKLGGLMHFAQGVKGNHERFTDYFTYIARQLEKNGVEVKFRTRMDATKVKEAAPDAVILAVGGKRVNEFKGDNVFPIERAFGSDKLGEKVVVLGASVQAIDMAAYLVGRGKQVTIVNPKPLDEVDKGQSGWFRTYMLPYLYANGVKIWNDATVKSVDAASVTITTGTGFERALPCDSVVEAWDMVPNTDLAEEIKALGIEVVCVGDCADPHNIQRAVRSGNLAARAL